MIEFESMGFFLFHVHYRKVVAAAGEWQMEPVAWMFEGSPDVDADVEMMLELRTELSELVKASEKITAVGRGQAALVRPLHI